jgi:thiol-disulfide isomerase/thioredoxin
LKPEWSSVAQDLIDDDTPAVLTAVDCTDDGKDLAKQYDVKGEYLLATLMPPASVICQRLLCSGYPTIKYFYKGKLVGDYSGGRKAVLHSLFPIM